MNILLGKESIEHKPRKKTGLKQQQLNILLLDHNVDDAKLIESFLRDKGLKFIFKRVETSRGFAEAVKKFHPSIILAEYVTSHFNGLKALNYIKKHRLEIPLIIVTEPQSEEIAVKCIKEGANDYILKTNLSLLPESIYISIESDKLNSEKESFITQFKMYHELYEQLLETLGKINIGFMIIDDNTKKILFVSESFCKMCRYEMGEIFELSSITELINVKSQYNFTAELNKADKPKNPIHIFNTILTRKDNKKINIQFTIRKFVLNNKTMIIMIARDISEIISKNLMDKLVEEALHESERRYRSLIENVKDYAIFMLDFNGRIISWNAGAERIFGYKENEIILKNFTVFLPKSGKTNRDLIGFLEKAKQNGHAEHEIELVKKDNQKLWASVTISSLNGKENSDSFSIIIRDLTKNKISEERLREQEIQLRSLAKHLQDAREEERQRIARELHDEFSQMLTVLRMDLTVLSHTISKTVTEPFKRISLLEKISTISELLEKTIRSTRRIITELRPAVLDELGLYTAIQWQAQEFENRTGIRCKILKLQYDINLDKHTSTAIFRILQEGLTNVVKHSHATSVVISLKMNKDKLILEIKDNGRGIDKNKLRAPTSTGLFGIRERVMALNGNFEIHSEKDQGTRLVVSVPCKEE